MKITRRDHAARIVISCAERLKQVQDELRSARRQYNQALKELHAAYADKRTGRVDW